MAACVGGVTSAGRMVSHAEEFRQFSVSSLEMSRTSATDDCRNPPCSIGIESIQLSVPWSRRALTKNICSACRHVPKLEPRPAARAIVMLSEKPYRMYIPYPRSLLRSLLCCHFWNTSSIEDHPIKNKSKKQTSTHIVSSSWMSL